VTLCDAAATILDSVGAGDAIAANNLPGASMLRLAGAAPEEGERDAVQLRRVLDLGELVEDLREKDVRVLELAVRVDLMDRDHMRVDHGGGRLGFADRGHMQLRGSRQRVRHRIEAPRFSVGLGGPECAELVRCIAQVGCGLYWGLHCSLLIWICGGR
jgi:hypothetical protein